MIVCGIYPVTQIRIPKIVSCSFMKYLLSIPLLLVMFVSCNFSKENSEKALDNSGVQITLKPNQMNFFGINSPTNIDSLLYVIDSTEAVSVKTFDSTPCDGITSATSNSSSANDYHVTNDVLLYGVPCKMDINIYHDDECANNDWIRDITFHSSDMDIEDSKKIISKIKAYYDIRNLDIDGDTIQNDVDILNCIIRFHVQGKNMKISFMNYRP